jgi:hypothetical protein
LPADGTLADSLIPEVTTNGPTLLRATPFTSFPLVKTTAYEHTFMISQSFKPIEVTTHAYEIRAQFHPAKGQSLDHDIDLALGHSQL